MAMDKYEVTESVYTIPVSYSFNELIKRVESDDDKVTLVNLWTTAHAMKRELETLTKLVKSVHRPY